MPIPLAVDPRMAAATYGVSAASRPGATTAQAKARATAEEFESAFLNTMIENMFTGISKDGPLGSGGATGVWRSFLTNEYARKIAKSGGIGIADQVYRALLERQGAQFK